METFTTIIGKIDDFVWSQFLLIPLLFLTGLVLTIRLKGVQFTKLFAALRLGLLHRKDQGAEGDISHYQALTTALAATVGVGNIAGVATAIAAGGPGALFWMWITGLLGMASKYAEAFLGSRFRETDAKGEQFGGPQVYLAKAIKGVGGKILAISFAVFGALAAFGIGNMTQVNTVAQQMSDTFHVNPLITGLVVMILVGLVLLGGIKRIGVVTAGFVPFMIIVYIIGGLIVLVANANMIGPAFAAVFYGAFNTTSAAGGVLGATVALAIQKGMARGIFSNESGMGSAAIVAAAAKTTHPVRQGLVSMTQTFIDTIIVVSFTGLVILTSGVGKVNGHWGLLDKAVSPDGETLAGAAITSHAFAGAIGGAGNYIVAISVVFFAVSTVLGWSYYGERCAVRLFGIRAQFPYRLVFTLVIMLGAWAGERVELVWTIADILNGLMALPNLIGLLILSGLIARETSAYLRQDPKLSKDWVPKEDLPAT